jgi:hypothetical protein
MSISIGYLYTEQWFEVTQPGMGVYEGERGFRKGNGSKTDQDQNGNKGLRTERKAGKITVTGTEYTQSGNCRFLA